MTEQSLSEILQEIKSRCSLDGEHWLWDGKYRYYGAPCMTRQGKTTSVRAVIATEFIDGYKPGMPVIPACKNHRCVAPGCLRLAKNSDLMEEGRRKRRAAANEVRILGGWMWEQLIRRVV